MTATRITSQEVAALLAAQEDGQFSGDKQLYPHWNIPFQSTALVRFLPLVDAAGNPDPNVLPWVEKRQIRLAFAGMTGSDNDTGDDVSVTVPSVETWGGSCKIAKYISRWWKKKGGSEEEHKLALTYWRRPTYLFNALIVSSPLQEATVPENPIRRLHLNRTIFDLVKTGCMNVEFEYALWDFQSGRDFKLVKTQQGSFANYATSSFSYKERALAQAELDAIAKYGIPDLQALIGTRPDQDTEDMIYQMFLDSLAGKPFDNKAYGAKFRAYTRGGPTTPTTATSNPSKPTAAPTRPSRTGNDVINDLKATQAA